MAFDQSAGQLIPTSMGFTEMTRPETQPTPNESAQTLKRRQRLKDMLVTKLVKQFGVASNPHAAAVVRTEADIVLRNKSTLTPADIRQLEEDILRTLRVRTSGTVDPPKQVVPMPTLTGKRVNWATLYDQKRTREDDAERRKAQREVEARELLRSQLRHQMGENEAARRHAEAVEAEWARRQRVDLQERERLELERQVAHRARVQQEVDLNKEHVRQVEKKRMDEAQLRRLEDERMLADIRARNEQAKRDKAQRAVEKAQHLELAKMQNERSRRLKAEAKAREEAEQMRLDAVWKLMLDEQERRREESLRSTVARQSSCQDAYGRTAGAEIAERARRDELNMLHWQKIYAEQQEARERRAKQRFDEQQRDILNSLTEQMARAERRRQEEKDADACQAAIDAQNLRMATEVDARLKAEQRRRAVEYQGELAHQARMVKEAEREGALNENYMTEADMLYNSHLVSTILDARAQHTASSIVGPMG